MDLSAPTKNEEGDDIPIEWLDFQFVKKCKDPSQLRRILAVLKSGKEGKYELLEQEVENSLLMTLSPSERDVWIAQNREPTRADKHFATSLVDGFIKEMSHAGSQNLLKKEKEATATTALPTISAPIRGTGGVRKSANLSASVQQPQSIAPVAASPVVTEPMKKRDTKAEPFNSYYKKWEQFDVDKAINEAEVTFANDERNKEAAERKPGSVIIEEIPTEKPLKKSSTTSTTMPSASSLGTQSGTQSINSLAAKREKEKGNECFKAGEFEDASNFYTRALRLEEPDSESYALLLSNRAQARLKLMQWESAEEDCNLSLNIGKGVIFKTLLRRAQARLKRGRYAEAVSDCRRVTTEFASEKGASLEASKIEAEALIKAKTAGMPLNEAEKTHVPPSVISSATNTKIGKRVMIEEEEEEEPVAPVEQLSSPLASLGSSARRLIIEEDDETEEDNEENAKVPAPVKVAAPFSAPVKTSDVPATVTVAAPVKTADVPAPIKISAPLPLPPSLPVNVKVEAPPLAKEEPLSPRKVERVRRLGLATEEREKGNSLFGKGQFEDAKAAYTLASELDPNDFSSFSNRAQVNLKLNDFDGAIADATIAINLLGVKADTAALANANEEGIAVKALFRRASAYKAKQEYESAVNDLTTALALAPESEKVLAELRELRSLSRNANGSAVSSPVPKVTQGFADSSPAPKVTHGSSVSSPVPQVMHGSVVSPAPNVMHGSSVSSPVPQVTIDTKSKPLEGSPSIGVKESPLQASSTESKSSQNVISPAVARATASALAAKATKTLLSSSATLSNSPMVIPQTANALSQAWKLRKRDPAALLTYMKQLSGTAICDLFKTPAEVDLVSGIIDGLKDSFTTTKPSKEDIDWLVDFLGGLSRSIGFSLISSMLDPKDKKNVQYLISIAEEGGAELLVTAKVLNAFGLVRSV